MSGRFLNIWVQKSGFLPMSTPELEKAFDLALDWYKFGSNNWIVWTTADINTWYSRLRPLINDEDRLLITEVNPNGRNGWMAKDFWEWFTRPNPEGKFPAKP